MAHCYQPLWFGYQKKKEKNKTESGESETTKKREKCWRKQKKKQKKSTNYTKFFFLFFAQLKSLQCPCVDTWSFHLHTLWWWCERCCWWRTDRRSCSLGDKSPWNNTHTHTDEGKESRSVNRMSESVEFRSVYLVCLKFFQLKLDFVWWEWCHLNLGSCQITSPNCLRKARWFVTCENEIWTNRERPQERRIMSWKWQIFSLGENWNLSNFFSAVTRKRLLLTVSSCENLNPAGGNVIKNSS